MLRVRPWTLIQRLRLCLLRLLLRVALSKNLHLLHSSSRCHIYKFINIMHPKGGCIKVDVCGDLNLHYSSMMFHDMYPLVLN